MSGRRCLASSPVGPTGEGGCYDGDDQTRISLLEYAGLGDRKPVYIDLELAAYQRSANLRQKIGLVVDHPDQKRPTPTGLILSSHDFDTKPDDLAQRVEAMIKAPACAAVKVAWTAHDLNDNLEAFRIIRSSEKPAVALCMGPHGVPSRVLAKKFGALLTFASLSQDTGTAPGQVTIDELKTRYRWDALGPSTAVYGVIGWPVGHSLSPAIHNAGFDELGYDGVYLPLPIEPSYEAFTEVAAAWLDDPDLNFRGASVTIPHKQNLLRFVRSRGGEVEPLALCIGAANTLTRRGDGSLYASNTDYAAALDAICDGMGIDRAGLKGRRAAVIGAGGAARAVVAGLAQYGATVVVYNRTFEKAQKLADELGRSLTPPPPETTPKPPRETTPETISGTTLESSSASAPDLSDPPDRVGKVVAARFEKLCDSCCEIYVNCTPIGMHPDTDATPIADLGRHKKINPGAVVFDTIYNPIETRLLREGREVGCLTISGVEMFVRQAALQFKLWTGRAAPVEVFREIVFGSLA